MKKMQVSALALSLVLTCGAAAQQTAIVPDMPHEGINYFPFGSVFGEGVVHQIISRDAFVAISGGQPIMIESIAYAPHTDTSNWSAGVTINIGHTANDPAFIQPPSDLTGGGAPNALGPVTQLFSNPSISWQFNNPPAGVEFGDYFQMVFEGTPVEYDPAQGHLLVEVVMTTAANMMLATSRVDGRPVSTRAVNRASHGPSIHEHIAQRIEIAYSLGEPECYANCDGSTTEPILTVDDFTCFINEFAAAQGLPPQQQIEHYANCDGSTTEPILTVDDFTCFINAFAQGCP